MLPEGPELLVPLGPLALARLPLPVALLAVAPVPLSVPAEVPPAPVVEALTPLPAVALPPVPTVLELLALPPPVPDVLDEALPPVLVVVLLSALRTPVPPSAWRPAAKPLLSVVLVPDVPAVCACAFMATASAAASRVMLSLAFISQLLAHLREADARCDGGCRPRGPAPPMRGKGRQPQSVRLTAALLFQARRALTALAGTVLALLFAAMVIG